MKLFKRYTSFPSSIQSIKRLLPTVVISLFLSACSAISETESELEKAHEATPESKALTQQDTEAVIIDEKAGIEVVQAPLRPAKNLYLQQQIDKPITIAEGVKKNYQQALTLMKEKKWQQAQVLLEQVTLQQPNLSGSYVNQAIIAKQDNKLVKAQSLLTKAIEVNNLNLYAHHLQGQVYRLQGAFEKSERSYLAALAIWPDFAEAHTSMAILLELYRGRLLEAHASYRAYLTLKPNDEEVKRWLAGLEIKIKRAGLEIPTKTLLRQSPEDEKTIIAAKELNHDKP